MIVRDNHIVERARGVSLKATVRTESRGAAPFELEYFVRGGQSEWLAQTADPFVAPLLQLAMARHEPLHIDGSVSPRLLRSVPTIMDIYEAWRPGVSRIDVIPASVATPRPPEKSCGLFFSGGVDSCYSLLKSDDPARSAEQVTQMNLRQREATTLHIGGLAAEQPMILAVRSDLVVFRDCPRQALVPARELGGQKYVPRTPAARSGSRA